VPSQHPNDQLQKLHNTEAQITRTINTTQMKQTKLKKLKVKFTLEYATKAQRGSRCIALLFFFFHLSAR